jgi:glycosyltransferase involved in cell wall biosynthesis
MNVIVLATYNGAAWLGEFVDSLRRQSVVDWHLLIRDDGSTDATPALLAEAAARDSRISLLDDAPGRLGVTSNFAHLLHRARERQARYVFLADQDDVWLPDKLQQQLALIRQAEASAGAGTPLLVHSDLTLVDRGLRVIHPSHSRCTRLARDRQAAAPLRTLLTNNFVTGCTALLNRPLLDVALPLPPSAVLHDWWVALCAAAFGEIRYLDEPTVLYRQHGSNVVGAEPFWTKLNPLSGRWRAHWQRTLQAFRRGARQACALRSRAEERGGLAADRRALIDAYADLLESRTTPLARLRAARRLQLGRRGPLNRLLLAARFCALPEDAAA